MALQFKKYESTATELETLGTVASQIPGGSLKFVPGTFTSGKRVAIILLDKNGDSTVVACSSRVSTTLHNALKNGASKKEMLAAVSNLEISEDKQGRNFISAPRGSGGQEESFAVGQLKSEKITHEDLVEW